MAPSKDMKTISNPRRCLILSEPGYDPRKLNELFPRAAIDSPLSSETPLPESEHLQIENEYYTASIPIWRDTISNLSEWEQEFSRPEAEEVIRAVGAWVYCLDLTSFKTDTITDSNADAASHDATSDAENTLRSVLECLNRVIAHTCGELDDWEGVRLVVLTSQSGPVAEELFAQLEDTSLALGFEMIDANATGRNAFGELCGLARAREVLEANKWGSGLVGDDQSASNDFGEFVDGDNSVDGADLLGLDDVVTSLLHDDHPEGSPVQVEDLDRLMSRAMAIKEQGSHLPMEQRKTFAADAIRELMQTGRV